MRARFDNIRLHGADLTGADLRFARLRNADLTDAILDYADLSDAVLDGIEAGSASIKKAKLHRTRAVGATFEDAEFTDSDMIETDCTSAALAGAIFLRSNLDKTNFSAADMRGAVFYYAQMTETVLRGSRLNGAYFGGVTINDVDLSVATGLNEIIHRSASFVSFGTMRQNPTPEVMSFLGACGLNDIELSFGNVWSPSVTPEELIDIGYTFANLHTMQPIMLHPLFVSYSHTDGLFVDKLELELQRHGVRCWRDVKDMTVGPVDTQIDRAIRMNPTVLLVLSRASVRSDWVEWEAAAARRIERELGGAVLCPITLDEEWKTCDWPGPLRQQIESYHLLDFSGWSNDQIFQRQFARLREGLRAYYSNPRS